MSVEYPYDFPTVGFAPSSPPESLTRMAWQPTRQKIPPINFYKHSLCNPDLFLWLPWPTASGKSAAALQFGSTRQHWQTTVEIINVDSALVYRSMDIRNRQAFVG